MKTTLNKIRQHSPCEEGWKQLLAHLGKTKADDEPLLIRAIIESNGFDDALWCLVAVDGHDKEIRLLAVKYVRKVQHLMKDPRSIAALDVAERFANGEATKQELDAAWAAASDAASDAAWDAASDAAWDAARGAASDAAWAAARVVAWDAARDAAWGAARGAARGAAWAAASDAAWAAARGAASDAARNEQKAELIRICLEIEARENT